MPFTMFKLTARMTLTPTSEPMYTMNAISPKALCRTANTSSATTTGSGPRSAAGMREGPAATDAVCITPSPR
jgi:hypothetical protein